MLTEPDPKLRPTAREALSHPWFALNRVPPSPLIPADEIMTPGIN